MRLAPLLVLLLPASALAQTTEIQTARAAAMGGAFRALAFDNSAVDLNPAAMSQIRKFDFEGGYFRTTDLEGMPEEYALQVSIGDSLTNAVATGLAFEFHRVRVRTPGGGTETFDVQRYVTGVGIPVIPQTLSIGMNGKAVRLAQPGKDKNTFTGDFAVHARPFRMLALAAGFDNLVNGGEPEAPRTIVGGVGFLPASWFALSADVFQDLATDPDEDHLGWAAGAQWIPAPWLALRGGVHEPAQDPDLRERVWTAGFGFLSQTGSIDYCARLSDGESDVLSHHVTVSVLVF